MQLDLTLQIVALVSKMMRFKLLMVRFLLKSFGIAKWSMLSSFRLSLRTCAKCSSRVLTKDRQKVFFSICQQSASQEVTESTQKEEPLPKKLKLDPQENSQTPSLSGSLSPSPSPILPSVSPSEEEAPIPPDYAIHEKLILTDFAKFLRKTLEIVKQGFPFVAFVSPKKVIPKTVQCLILNWLHLFVPFQQNDLSPSLQWPNVPTHNILFINEKLKTVFTPT